jgi:hypothetical protein
VFGGGGGRMHHTDTGWQLGRSAPKARRWQTTMSHEHQFGTNENNVDQLLL